MLKLLINLHDKVTIADFTGSVENHKSIQSRTSVIDELIVSVSTIGHSDFIVNRLWLPSSIKLLSSESFYENGNEIIKSVVIEHQSRLAIIE
jgi:hypothetical protein